VAVPFDADASRQPDRVAWADPSYRYGDYALFVRAGHAILSGNFGGAYSDPAVQTGPLALVWAAALALVLNVLHAPGAVGFAITVVAVVAPSAYAASLWASRHRPPRGLFVGAVGALIVLLVPWELADLLGFQHPTYLWVPALWLFAAAAARRDRSVVTALLLVVACALETWAILAVPVLLLSLPSWRARFRGGAVWVVGTAAVWAPFAFSGQFRMFDMVWPASFQTPLLALWGHPAAVTWEIRVAQGAIVVLASVGAWLVGRTATDAATVAVVVVAWTRIATDSQWFPYYRSALFVTSAAVLLAAGARYLRTRHARTLPALVLSGLMCPLAQSELLAIPMLASAAVHVGTLAVLVVTARQLGASPTGRRPWNMTPDRSCVCHGAVCPPGGQLRSSARSISSRRPTTNAS